MSIAIDHAQYFTAAYVNRVSAAPAVSDGTASAGTGETAATETASAAPLSSPQLLSNGDLRMLLLRDVKGEELEGYKDILNAFYADPANRDDPVGFLENLSDEGIDLLKKAQSLPMGVDVNIQSLNQEEALNFILPHTSKVDLNNDSMIAGPNGGKMFQFPPPNAPQDVKDAWAAATEGLSDRDNMLLSSKFLFMQMSANMYVDENGKVSVTEPGDEGYRNIFAEPGFSYRDAIERFKEGNEFSRNLNTTEIYERTKELLTRLGSVFDDYGIA